MDKNIKEDDINDIFNNNNLFKSKKWKVKKK